MLLRTLINAIIHKLFEQLSLFKMAPILLIEKRIQLIKDNCFHPYIAIEEVTNQSGQCFQNISRFC